MFNRQMRLTSFTAGPFGKVAGDPSNSHKYPDEKRNDRIAKIGAEHPHAALNARSIRVSSQRASRLYSGSQRTFGMGSVLAVGCLLVPCWALAQVPAAPGATVPRDPRLPIALAEARRENWKCLMRCHLQSLTESIRPLSSE